MEGALLKNFSLNLEMKLFNLTRPSLYSTFSVICASVNLTLCIELVGFFFSSRIRAWIIVTCINKFIKGMLFWYPS